MTDDYTADRWRPERSDGRLPPLFARVAAAMERALDSAEIKTVPPGPFKAPDYDELRRIADRARAARPEGDRFVMARPTLDALKVASPPPTLFGRFGFDPFAIQVFVDDSLPYGVVEFRDGDDVVRRYVLPWVATRSSTEENLT